MAILNIPSLRHLAKAVSCILVLVPAFLSAGMSPAEIKQFQETKILADQGNPAAQVWLGTCYAYGIGVAKDGVAAVRLFRKVAEQGDASAQYNLGVCYDVGLGVAQDAPEAVKWYRKAGDQRYAGGLYCLATCYQNGIGVSKDEIEADAYLHLAGMKSMRQPMDTRQELARLEATMSLEARLKGQQRAIELQKEIEAKIAAAKVGK